MTDFDWHNSPLTRDTPITKDYRSTQNVRRFLTAQCGENFAFDRPLMAWIKDGKPKTLGDAADEWLRRK